MSVFLPINVDVGVELANLLDQGAEHKQQEGANAALLGQNNVAGLVAALVRQLPQVFAGSAGDAEATVSLALALVAGLPAAQAEPILLQLAQALVTQLFEGQNRRHLQLRLLGSIFNLVPAASPSGRAAVLGHILSFAQLAGLQRVLVEKAGLLASMIRGWGAGVQPLQASRLFGQLADLFKGAPLQQHAAPKYRFLQLQALNGAGAEFLAQERATAEAILVTQLADPTVYQLDRFLELEVVQSMAQDAQAAKSLQLLRILVEANDIQSFQAFEAAEAAYFARTQLKPAQVLAKLRSLILAGTAETQKRIEFDLIQRRLGLTGPDQVEAAVIAAIRVGIIQAKIDEENGCIRVSSAVRRNCNASLWHSVSGRLGAWKESVRKVLISLHEAQAAEDDLLDGDDHLQEADYILDSMVGGVEDDEEIDEVDDDDYLMGGRQQALLLPQMDDDMDDDM